MGNQPSQTDTKQHQNGKSSGNGSYSKQNGSSNGYAGSNGASSGSSGSKTNTATTSNSSKDHVNQHAGGNTALETISDDSETNFGFTMHKKLTVKDFTFLKVVCNQFNFQFSNMF